MVQETGCVEVELILPTKEPVASGFIHTIYTVDELLNKNQATRDRINLLVKNMLPIHEIIVSPIKEESEECELFDDPDVPPGVLPSAEESASSSDSVDVAASWDSATSKDGQ